MRVPPAILVTLLFIATALPTAAQPGAEAEQWATGLDKPVDLTFDSEGRLYYSELGGGNVRVLHPNGTPSEPLVHVPASEGGNGGFTGLVADPDETGILYAYYSMEKPDAVNGKVNRVVKLNVTSGEETVFLDDIRWAELHNGGRLAIGPDEHLYVTVGDNGLEDPAQDKGSILGKVLRMTLGGEPAPGNPEGWHPLAYSTGWRNPFGITVAPDGEIYVSDNGGQEEVNRLAKGGNYGWPQCTGDCPEDASTVEPVAFWDEHFGPTGIAVHGNTLYLGDFVFGQVRTVDLETGEDGVFWKGDAGPLLDVEVGPDECLYMSTWDSVYRAPLGDGECALPRTHSFTGDPDDGGNDTPAPPVAGALVAVAALALMARRRL